MTSRREYHSLWAKGTPAQTNIGTSGILVALAFVPTSAGQIVATEMFRQTGDGQNHVWWIVHQDTSSVVHVDRAGAFIKGPGGTATGGWQTKWFHPFYRVVPNDLYELVVWFPLGKYANMVAAHSPDTDTVVGPLTIPKAGGTIVTNNGVTATTLTLTPGVAIGNAKPAIDIQFHLDGEA